MDSILTLKQHTILIRIVSFLGAFENIGLKLILPLASPMLLGMAILMSLYLYCREIIYLDSIICSIFWTSLSTLYLALPAKEID